MAEIKKKLIFPASIIAVVLPAVIGRISGYEISFSIFHSDSDRGRV